MALVPRGIRFESRHDVGRYCAHDPEAVRVVGNVDRFKLWRCMDCLNEVVPVLPGWEWDRRRQEHVHLEAARRAAAAGHLGRYLEHEPPEGWAVNEDLIPRPSAAELEEWLRDDPDAVRFAHAG